jgi:pimeloyl-ACP methyl ester carboxylesterase
VTSLLRDQSLETSTVAVRREPLGVGTTTPLEAFERDRLALFARYGCEAESRRVGDRERLTNLLVRGAGAHPTVLLHGGLSQSGEWAPLAGKLPGHVVIPDRPGCGLSYPVDYRGVDYRKAAADWLSDLLDEIDAEQVDLVGNSMGGFFSIAFAVAHPDRVRRLVLVGAPAGLDRQLPLFIRLWGNPVIGPLLVKAGMTAPRDGEVLRDRVFARLLVAHPEEVPLDILELAVVAQALPGVERSSYSMLRAVTTLRGWRRELIMRDALASLRVPTRFLWGDADAFAPPSSGGEMVARMPDAAIEVIPDTGHLPHLERPDAVANAIVGLGEGGRSDSAIRTRRRKR